MALKGAPQPLSYIVHNITSACCRQNFLTFLALKEPPLSPMLDATVLHGGPIYEGELAVLIKAHIWGVHWLFGCYDFGPKTAKTQLAAAFACISVE